MTLTEPTGTFGVAKGRPSNSYEKGDGEVFPNKKCQKSPDIRHYTAG
ncbi:hypothetical protein DFP92_106109 [Yoonia sediminilitoris]|uniref:Uncharacterized protein n=1 Tax=Yoonia sediminilitoris TaxID=1286148 RepID=A0A2T6KFX8_9RHOB|nr:hypothetical protein C8N45_106109 [Yoonia sediminilitoris]RCW95166.1 hypothetical protein DFP92_106109 [Yoonia sediminilitoris]